MEITGQAVCADFVPDNDEERIPAYRREHSPVLTVCTADGWTAVFAV